MLLRPGTWDLRVSVGTKVGCLVPCAPVRVEVTGVGPFVRGDCNGDETVDIADAICILEWAFGEGVDPPCAAASNVNFDFGVNTSDAVYLLLFLAGSGPGPTPPFPGCGEGPLRIDEILGCAAPPGRGR